MKSLLFSVLFFALFMAACDRLRSNHEYEMISSTDGKVYRLDKSSGDVWIINDRTLVKLDVRGFQLKIGQRYVGEDTYSFTYLGKGKVGDIKTLADIIILKGSLGPPPPEWNKTDQSGSEGEVAKPPNDQPTTK